MEDLRRIERPVSVPQPVGHGTRSQPGHAGRDAFRDILERKRGRQEPEAEPETPSPAAEDRDKPATEAEPAADERGQQIDERA